jgi:hypothetical protein
MSRGMMSGAMRLCQAGFCRPDVVQRARRIQRSDATGANAETNHNQHKCPNTRKLHPASILSPKGVSCRAFPLGSTHFVPFQKAAPQIMQSRRLCKMSFF